MFLCTYIVNYRFELLILKLSNTFIVKYRDYILSVSQEKIVHYIVDSQPFELKENLIIAFALNNYWYIPRDALDDVYYLFLYKRQ